MSLDDSQLAIKESLQVHPLDGKNDRYFLGLFQTSKGIVRAFLDINAETLAVEIRAIRSHGWESSWLGGKLLIVPIETKWS